MKTLLLIVSVAIILVGLLVIYGCVVMASRCSREEERKKDPFRIIYRSNTIQFDEMGYPLRLCIVTGNGRDKPEQVWLDTLEEEDDVVLEFKKMEREEE